MEFPNQYDVAVFFQRSTGIWECEAEKAGLSASVNNIHNLRRTTRRLRTYLWAIPRAKRTKHMSCCIKALHELSDELGSCRTLQVALQDAKSFQFSKSVQQSIFRNLTLRLKNSQKSLKVSLSAARRATLLKMLLHSGADLKLVCSDSVFKKLQKTAGKITREAKNVSNNPAKLHQIRILIKKLNIFLDDFGVQNPALVVLQKTLGRWHDLVSLESLVFESAKGELNDPQALKALELWPRPQR